VTLGADYTEIQQELGFHLGFGRVVADFSTEDSESIVAWIKSGLRRFLFSAFQIRTGATYHWSFLRKVWHFGTQIGQIEYDLPADFGAPDGPILWESPQTAYRPIPIMNEAFVRMRLSQMPNVTGIPLAAAVFHKLASGVTEQKRAMVVYPPPDASYPFRMPYHISGEMLTEGFPWPPGGSPHARTLLYACLAEATKRHDDNASYENDYQLALAASMDYDARNAGDSLGYCDDPRQREQHGWDDERFHDLRVLVDGVQY
jgi:hypothetical protein